MITNKDGKIAVRNGDVKTSIGYRQILTDSKLKIKPVLFKQYSGWIPDRTTFQASPDVGDLLFKIEWSTDEYVEDVLVWNGKDFESFETDEFDVDNAPFDLLFNKYPDLEEFLKIETRAESCIPLSIVPEKDYISIKMKRKKLKTFFDKYKLPKEFYDDHEFIKMAKDDLRDIPIYSEKSSLYHTPRDVDTRTELNNIRRYERWFSWDGDSSEEIVLEPTLEHHDSETNELCLIVGKPINEVMPENAKVLIKISYGLHTKKSDLGNESYGRRIEVYKTKLN